MNQFYLRDTIADVEINVDAQTIEDTVKRAKSMNEIIGHNRYIAGENILSRAAAKERARKHFLAAKYDRGYEIGCDGCGETWATTCEGFREAVLSVSVTNHESCISCNDDLADKIIK